MERKFLLTVVSLCLFNTLSLSLSLAETYLQGIGTDHALSYSHDRFYSGSNRAFIGQGYDWSGVGRNSASQWATMISPSYFISSNHYHPSPGDTVTFYAGNSTSSPSYSFAVASGILVPGSSDLYLGRLSAPIPSSSQIAMYPLWVLGANSAYIGKDMFTYGVPDRVGRNVISYVSTSKVSCTFSASGGDGPDEAYPMSGDSGGPSFGYYNGQLALVGAHWQNSGSPYDGAPFSDTYVPGYISAIQANMVGETLSVASLTTSTWNTSSGNWSATSSWSQAIAPGASDIAVLNLTVGETIVNVDANSTVATLGLLGSGTLTINGNPLTVSRAVAVGAGQSLQGSGSISAPAFEVNGGTLGGSLNLTGNIVSSGGHFTPGGATELTVVGNVTLDASSVATYRFGPAGGEDDQISIIGDLVLDGMISVTALTGFGPAAGSPSASYTLFTYTGSLMNNNPEIDMPATQLNSIDGYNYTYSGTLITTSAEVNLVVTLEGDANGDGKLDPGDIDALYERYGTDAAAQAAVSAELISVFRTSLGDSDLDHSVDFSDFQTMQDHWLRASTWAAGDFDGNGVTDFADFQILLNNWNPQGMTQSSQLPEPVTLSLLILGSLTFLRRR